MLFRDYEAVVKETGYTLEDFKSQCICMEELGFERDGEETAFLLMSGEVEFVYDGKCEKAYRKDVIKNIEVYGEMHRYIPYLAKNAGFSKIGEKVVHHQARKFGSTKFGGWNRFVNGYLDLLSLWFLNSFGLKPMHVFGFLGSIMFFIGVCACVAVGALKLTKMYMGMPYNLVTDSPYFFIALTMMILGTQLFVAGFLGELISRNAPERNNYKIEKEI